MNVPSLTDMVGDESVFFDKYFGRKPLLNQGALADSYRELLTIADLDELLNSESTRPPYIQLAKESADLPVAAYTTAKVVTGEQVTDCVVPEKVMEHFRAGATIGWPSINPGRPHLRELSAALAKRFGVPTDLIAFLSPAGVQAFRPHYDPVDLFVIQLHGTKYWRVWPTSEKRRAGKTNFTQEELGKPLYSVTLRPGDVMYLPNSTPHVVAAEDSMSLHVSMIVRPRRWSDLLQRLVHVAMEGEPEFWEFPYLNHANQDTLEEQLVAAIGSLHQKLTAMEPEQAMADLLAWGAGVDAAHITYPFTEMARAEQRSQPCAVSRTTFADYSQ